MFKLIQSWFRHYFSDPQASVLLLMLIIACVVIYLFGSILAPLLAGLVLAYLLEAVVSPMHRYCWVPRWLAITVVFLIFIGVLVLFFLWLVPLLYKQLSQLVAELPNMINSFHLFLQNLPKQYPIVSQRAVNDLIASTNFSSDKIASLTKAIFSFSISSLPSIITWIVYVFLVPLLALFFMKDRKSITKWSMQFAPHDRGLLVKVWSEMEHQLGNYVRGKALEIIIVWVCNLYWYASVWFELCTFISLFCRVECDNPLYRDYYCDNSSICGRRIAIWSGCHICVYADCLYCDSGTGWLRSGATFIFRRGQLTSYRYYRCGIIFWWYLGILGAVFRHSFSNFGECIDEWMVSTRH